MTLWSPFINNNPESKLDERSNNTPSPVNLPPETKPIKAKLPSNTNQMGAHAVPHPGFWKDDGPVQHSYKAQTHGKTCTQWLDDYDDILLESDV